MADDLEELSAAARYLMQEWPDILASGDSRNPQHGFTPCFSSTPVP